MDIEQGNKIHIDCECSSHVLKVVSDVEDNFQSFYLMMFNYGNSKSGWRYKLRTCWRVLKTGSPYSDQLTLHPDEARKLANFINDNLIQQQ